VSFPPALPRSHTLRKMHRQRVAAALGSAAFFVVAPGVVAGLVPGLITEYRFEEPLPGWLVLRVVGAALIAAGLAALVHAFARFVREGLGTPAPVAPTETLVVGGLYRYVRNPMYLAVGAIIVGQALLFGQLALLAYAAAFFATVAAFVRLYEEPMLRGTFGDDYRAYCDAVPAWWPRRRAWQPERP
jgi:protein-S-isoprenylcysteine O-methyltransferase Ste14